MMLKGILMSAKLKFVPEIKSGQAKLGESC